MCFLDKNSEQPQHVFGHLVSGEGVVPQWLVLQQLAKSHERAAGDGQREFGVVDAEPAGVQISAPG